MKRLILGAVIICVALGALSACGIKNPPKYIPDSSKTEPKKS